MCFAGYLGKGVWGKMKDWLERWADESWKNWKEMKGMVYAWVSIRTGKCYIGSTKGTMMERARTHLKLVRRIREKWKEKGEHKLEDKEIMSVHYEIARKPGEWVLIPVTGELQN